MLRFLLIGLIVACLEEFISQGVLKNRLVAWLPATIIAFGPFLIVMGLVGRGLDHYLSAAAASRVYYLIAGAIGLAFEWFVMGLTPWPQFSLLQLGFQIGMLSFWVSVAYAPRLLLDERPRNEPLRKVYRRALMFGFAFIYIVTFVSPSGIRMPTGIISILVMFTLLNYYYFIHMRSSRNDPEPAMDAAGEPVN